MDHSKFKEAPPNENKDHSNKSIEPTNSRLSYKEHNHPGIVRDSTRHTGHTKSMHREKHNVNGNGEEEKVNKAPFLVVLESGYFTDPVVEGMANSTNALVNWMRRVLGKLMVS